MPQIQKLQLHNFVAGKVQIYVCICEGELCNDNYPLHTHTHTRTHTHTHTHTHTQTWNRFAATKPNFAATNSRQFVQLLQKTQTWSFDGAGRSCSYRWDSKFCGSAQKAWLRVPFKHDGIVNNREDRQMQQSRFLPSDFSWHAYSPLTLWPSTETNVSQVGHNYFQLPPDINSAQHWMFACKANLDWIGSVPLSGCICEQQTPRPFTRCECRV